MVVPSKLEAIPPDAINDRILGLLPKPLPFVVRPIHDVVAKSRVPLLGLPNVRKIETGSPFDNLHVVAASHHWREAACHEAIGSRVVARPVK
jgi:hypothetical protein